MAPIIDQYNGDPIYAHLHVLTNKFPLARDMLKTASFETTKTKIAELPSSAFAWEDERRFPVHTREDTIASIFYRSKLGSTVPQHVDDKLELARNVYEIDDAIFSPVKEASVDITEYALPEKERLPLNSPEQIKVAEEVLCRDYDTLPLEKRADAFNRLYTAAKKQDVELRPFSLRMAGVTVSNPHLLRDWLEARATAATEPVHQQAYTKLASAMHKTPSCLVQRRDLVKLATTIYELDKLSKLNKHYDRKLPDPLQTVFNTEKIAEEMCDVGGIQVPCSALMTLPPDVWAAIDAPEIGEIAASGDPAQFKAVFDTLPLDLKIELQAYVTSNA